MRLSDYGEFVKELEMTALGKQAAAILRNLENNRDEAVKQLAESRGRFGDMEARVVELEAVIRAVDDWFNDLGSQHVPNGNALARLLEAAPSEVLADRNAAVWDQGFVASENHKGVVAMEGQPWRVTTPVNPYRGDNR